MYVDQELSGDSSWLSVPPESDCELGPAFPPQHACPCWWLEVLVLRTPASVLLGEQHTIRRLEELQPIPAHTLLMQTSRPWADLVVLVEVHCFLKSTVDPNLVQDSYSSSDAFSCPWGSFHVVGLPKQKSDGLHFFLCSADGSTSTPRRSLVDLHEHRCDRCTCATKCRTCRISVLPSCWDAYTTCTSMVLCHWPPLLPGSCWWSPNLWNDVSLRFSWSHEFAQNAIAAVLCDDSASDSVQLLEPGALFFVEKA